MFKALLLFFLLPGTSLAIQDTLQLKRELALSFITETELRTRMKAVLPEYQKGFPELKLEDVTRVFDEEVDWEKLNSDIVNIMVDLYTLEELKLLSDFYTSIVGKSISQKSPLFTRAFLPIMRQEMERCLRKTTAKEK